LSQLEVAFVIAARAPASNAHASNAVVLEQSLQAFATFSFALTSSLLAAFDLGTSFRMGAPAVASRAVALNNLIITENGALGNVLTRARIGLRSTAWSFENRSFVAGSAVGFLTWSCLTTFDLVASFRIDAPRMTGAAATLPWSEEAIIIALGLRASNAD